MVLDNLPNLHMLWSLHCVWLIISLSEGPDASICAFEDPNEWTSDDLVFEPVSSEVRDGLLQDKSLNAWAELDSRSSASFSSSSKLNPSFLLIRHPPSPGTLPQQVDVLTISQICHKLQLFFFFALVHFIFSTIFITFCFKLSLTNPTKSSLHCKTWS